MPITVIVAHSMAIGPEVFVPFPDASDLVFRLMDTGAPLSAGQLRSNTGFVVKSLLMANFSLFAGFESLRLYHQMFVPPKNLHPIVLQYAFAVSVEG